MLALRPALAADLPTVDRIYNHYVDTSTCTYQLEHAGIAAREAWFAAHGAEHPVIVAELEGSVLGWGSLSTYNPRPGYRFTVEDSVYVDHRFHGRGVGRALLANLIDRAHALGHHTILSFIDAEQTPSVRLHERFGFVEVGRLREVGRKFDRWLDIVYLQRRL